MPERLSLLSVSGVFNVSYFLNFLRPNPARPTIPTPNRNKEAGSGTEIDSITPLPSAKPFEIRINPKTYRIRSTEMMKLFFKIFILMV